MSVKEGDRKPKKNLEAAEKARALAVHTLRICGNRNVFNPYVRTKTGEVDEDGQPVYVTHYNPCFDSLVSELCTDELEFSHMVWNANNIRVRTRTRNGVTEYSQIDAGKRRGLQDDAIRRCNDLLADMQVAKSAFHLPGKKVKHWGKMTVEAREKIRAWRDSDVRRYGGGL